MGLRSKIVKKIILSIFLVFFASSINFVIFRLIPGNPIYVMAGVNISWEKINYLSHVFGLDRPLWEQYLYYLWNMLRGEWGVSFWTARPIIVEIGERIGNTVILLATSGIISGFIGLYLALFSEMKRFKKYGELGLAISLILYSFPVFWLGLLLLLVFAVYLHILPIGGTFSIPPPPDLLGKVVDYLRHMILPAATLILSGIGGTMLIVKGAIREELKQDYVLTARAKGLSQFQVLSKHVLRNALLPFVTFAALTFGYILAGTILVEIVFSWNGLGLYMYRAIFTVDYPALQGSFFLIAVTIIIANAIADFLYAYLDPRVRT